MYNAFTSRVEKRVDPDQLASEKPADLDLECFQKRMYQGPAWQGLNLDKTTLACASGVDSDHLGYQSSLCTLWTAYDLHYLQEDSEDDDQAWQTLGKNDSVSTF